ncbi:MAG: hypothetical protein WDO19_11850 [Bacteroidota bacterium]
MNKIQFEETVTSLSPEEMTDINGGSFFYDFFYYATAAARALMIGASENPGGYMSAH